MPENIDIFMASDDNYAKYVAVAALSVAERTQETVQFHILDSGITQANKDRILAALRPCPNAGLEFLPADLDERFAHLQAIGYITRATYARFLIPKLFPRLRRAIYLDCDIVCLGDVAGLAACDLNGHVLGAVWERRSDRAPKAGEKSARALRLEALGVAPSHRYFNAGVLVLDCLLWNGRDIESRVLEVSRRARLNDQDILNIVFENDYQPLDERYNVINQLAGDHLKDGKLADCVVRHFTDRKKPDAYFPIPLARKPRYSGFREFWQVARRTPFLDAFVAGKPLSRWVLRFLAS